MHLSPTIRPLATDLKGVFCVTRAATRKGDVKSRETKSNQSGWAESMLLLAERHGDNTDNNSLWSHTHPWLDWTFFHVGKLRDSRKKSDLPTVWNIAFCSTIPFNDHCPRHLFSTIRPDPPNHNRGRGRERRDESHANPVWIWGCCWLLSARRKMKRTTWTQQREIWLLCLHLYRKLSPPQRPGSSCNRRAGWGEVDSAFTSLTLKRSQSWSAVFTWALNIENRCLLQKWIFKMYYIAPLYQGNVDKALINVTHHQRQT